MAHSDKNQGGVARLIKAIEQLDKAARSIKLPYIDKEVLERGIRASALATRDPEFVATTPLMKALLVIMGDVKQTQGADGEWHTDKLKVGAKSRAVEWINEVVRKALTTFNGKETHDYPVDLPIDSEQFLNVDCWNGWKEGVWDIVPGQREEAEEGIHTYEESKTNLSVPQILRLLQGNKAAKIAAEWLMYEVPAVQAERGITKIHDPFMSKGTGVSYPDFANDRTYLPNSEVTYGQYEMNLAREALAKGYNHALEWARQNSVFTLYMRRQRGKGRPLIAESRRTNLILNCVNGPEMEKWKADPALGAAFWNEEKLLAHLAELGDWVLSHPGYTAINYDYSKWDRNLGIGLIALQNAARLLKAPDRWTEDLIIMRHQCASRAPLLDGIERKKKIIYGRQFSGYLDTTLGNTAANRFVSRAGAVHSDPSHIERVARPLRGRDLTVVGDDVLLVTKDGGESAFIDYVNNVLGTVIHEDEKHARGLMFIQYRCIKFEGKWIITYNWPRVLRSMLSKESSKQLGKGGWTVSFYQQLGKCRMHKPSLAILVGITAALDQYHLSLDTPVETILEWVKEEDKLRVAQGARNRKKKMERVQTTAERLYNSNPNIPGVITKPDGSVELDRNYFEKLQLELREVYDPQFLQKLGFQAPDLSRVH